MDKEAEKILKTGYTANSQCKYSYVQSQYEEWLKETNNNAMEQNTMINYLMVLNSKHSPGLLLGI
eukprot:11288227-Ditylum_brightwellii.AAC.1